jgi:hypothetical protein
MTSSDLANDLGSEALETRRSGRRCLLIASIVTVISATWVYYVSDRIGLVPGAPIVDRTNVLFQSDCSATIYDFIHTREYPPWIQAKHPLNHWIQIEPVHYISAALALAMLEDRAPLVAGRAFNAILTGLGIASIVFMALRSGFPLRFLPPMFLITLLSTSTIIAAVPEHFGVSYALLSVTFAVASSDLRLPTALGLLFLLEILCAGVTITNGLFPVMAGFALVWKHSGCRFPVRFLAAMCLGAAVAGLTFTGLASIPRDRLPPLMQDLRTSVGKFIHVRVDDPLSFPKYSFRGLVDPIIGPTPDLDRNNWQHRPMLTYESSSSLYSIWPYDVLQSAGATSWLIMLALSCLRFIRSPDCLGSLLFAWIAFNLALHNLWGDEFFLFSPHWSWALIAMVYLRIPRSPWVFLLCLPLAIAQLHTLTRIWEMIPLVLS